MSWPVQQIKLWFRVFREIVGDHLGGVVSVHIHDTDGHAEGGRQRYDVDVVALLSHRLDLLRKCRRQWIYVTSQYKINYTH